MTLQQAVTLGLKQAPEIAIANLNLAESQQARTAARGALLPQLSFSVTEKVQRASLEALFGKKVPGFPDHSGPFWSFEAGPTASLPVFGTTMSPSEARAFVEKAGAPFLPMSVPDFWNSKMPVKKPSAAKRYD